MVTVAHRPSAIQSDPDHPLSHLSTGDAIRNYQSMTGRTVYVDPKSFMDGPGKVYDISNLKAADDALKNLSVGQSISYDPEHSKDLDFALTHNFYNDDPSFFKTAENSVVWGNNSVKFRGTITKIAPNEVAIDGMLAPNRENFDFTVNPGDPRDLAVKKVGGEIIYGPGVGYKIVFPGPGGKTIHGVVKVTYANHEGTRYPTYTYTPSSPATLGWNSLDSPSEHGPGPGGHINPSGQTDDPLSNPLNTELQRAVRSSESRSPTTPSTNQSDPTLDDFRDNSSHNTGTASGRGTTGDVFGDNDARHNGGGDKSGQSTAGGQTGSTSTSDNHADKIEGGGDNGHQGGTSGGIRGGDTHGNYDKPDTSLKGNNGLLGGGVPILLDLTGAGIQVAEYSRSQKFVDSEADGKGHRTAWAGVGTAVLFVDSDGSNTINEKKEYIFTEWDRTAVGDIEAIRSVFDSNHDGK
ncbi:MAG: hypothetical protein HYX36_11360, partial [Rhizobiales bacterium]|nr:hypothetical protein [Hyphomicrobiales bacterium]